MGAEMESRGTHAKAALENVALRLVEGFEPDGGSFPEAKLRSFDAAGLTLRGFHEALVAGTARILSGASLQDVAAAYGESEYGWLVAEVSEALRFDYEEAEAEDADLTLAALAEAAKAGLTFSDLADALPAAVARLGAEFPPEEEPEVGDDEEVDEIVRLFRDSDALRAAFGFTGPRSR